MKALNATCDRKEVFRIEAARYSFEIIQACFQDLYTSLQAIEQGDTSSSQAIMAFRNAWQVIDYAHRYCTLLSQVRNLKHKDARYKTIERCQEKVGKARNYIQHLTTSIPNIPDESYPILGTLSWSSDSRRKSITLAIGSLPKGTQLHSLALDTKEFVFSSGVFIHFDSFNINLEKTVTQIKQGHTYLCEWLETNNLLSSVESAPSVLTFNVSQNVIDSMKSSNAL